MSPQQRRQHSRPAAKSVVACRTVRHCYIQKKACSFYPLAPAQAVVIESNEVVTLSDVEIHDNAIMQHRQRAGPDNSQCVCPRTPS